jgi:hypothetical protein
MGGDIALLQGRKDELDLLSYPTEVQLSEYEFVKGAITMHNKMTRL